MHGGGFFLLAEAEEGTMACCDSIKIIATFLFFEPLKLFLISNLL